LRRYVATYNHGPKPFGWTKTADQIPVTPLDFVSELLTQDTRSCCKTPWNWLISRVKALRSRISAFYSELSLLFSVKPSFGTRQKIVSIRFSKG